jgi:electron transfer flavoprotein beta subunit
MTNVLVCIKRVPDTVGEVLLTADEQAVDARFVGFTVSAHENCAVELAVRVASADGGTATVLSLGCDPAVEQLRSALGVGCSAAVLIEADPAGFGPADVSREIAAVVNAHAAEGHTYDGIDGVETYVVPLPAVVTVLEGGVEPRYPTITGRMKAKKTTIETVSPRSAPRGSGPCGSRCRPPSRARSRCSAKGRTPRPQWSTCCSAWG